MNDQWKLEGKCSECRRLSYCKKQCTKNKEATRKALSAMIRAKMKETTGIAPTEENIPVTP